MLRTHQTKNQYQSELPCALFFSTGLLYYWNLDLDWITSKSNINLTYWKYHKCGISEYKQVRRGEVSLEKQELQQLLNDNYRRSEDSKQS